MFCVCMCVVCYQHLTVVNNSGRLAELSFVKCHCDQSPAIAGPHGCPHRLLYTPNCRHPSVPLVTASTDLSQSNKGSLAVGWRHACGVAGPSLLSNFPMLVYVCLFLHLIILSNSSHTIFLDRPSYPLHHFPSPSFAVSVKHYKPYIKIGWNKVGTVLLD